MSTFEGITLTRTNDTLVCLVLTYLSVNVCRVPHTQLPSKTTNISGDIKMNQLKGYQLQNILTCILMKLSNGMCTSVTWFLRFDYVDIIYMTLHLKLLYPGCRSYNRLIIPLDLVSRNHMCKELSYLYLTYHRSDFQKCIFVYKCGTGLAPQKLI